MSTRISWVRDKDGKQGETWNPVRGCSKVSTGCKHCYAERQAARFSGPGQPYDGLVKDGHWVGQARLIPEALERPLRWSRPRMIFVNSMSDLFHESLSWKDVDKVFDVIERCPQHQFQILTKRPARMSLYFQLARLEGKPTWPLPNVWLGVSVEDQITADERIPLLLQIPAAIRFVSVEPMLERVDLRCLHHESMTNIDALTGHHGVTFPLKGQGPKLDWVISGAESGSKARPMDEAWARDLRDQCGDANVPFFLKQLMRNGTLVKMPVLDGLVWDKRPGYLVSDTDNGDR